MSTNLHPDIARGMVVPEKKKKTRTETAAAQSAGGKARVDHDSESGEEIVKRAAEQNDRDPKDE